MKNRIITLLLFTIVGCTTAPNIFEETTEKGGFILFETDLTTLHDILGDETVVNINLTDPNNNAVSYSVAIEKPDGTLTEIVATVSSFPKNLTINRQDILTALGFSSPEELPQKVKFIGIVTTNKGSVISGQDVVFNSTTNESTGGDTYYNGLAAIPRQAMKFEIVMFQQVKPNEETSFFITSEDDDVEEVLIDFGEPVGTMSLNSSDLELGELSGGDGLMGIGLRFNFVGLPKGATITTAKIQFQTDNTGSSPVEMTIYGENESNSKPFEDVLNNLTSRNLTDSSVVWNIPEWRNIGDRESAQLSVDFSNVLQEIINHSDWVPGNSITIILKPTGNSLNTTSTSGGREAETGIGDHSAELIVSHSN